jgi:hypothetical protein
MPADPKADRRATTGGIKARRIICMALLGVTLAGCDKCGGWWSPMRGESQVCREQAPQPQ